MTDNEWAKDFKAFVDEVQMQRDDYKGIMEYIDEGCALLKEQPKWISTNDAMPEVNKPVLIHEGNWVTMLVYTRRKVRGKVVERWEYAQGGIYHDRVDGWMPLPKAPVNK